jgi:hypothetical protein
LPARRWRRRDTACSGPDRQCRPVAAQLIRHSSVEQANGAHRIRQCRLERHAGGDMGADAGRAAYPGLVKGCDVALEHLEEVGRQVKARKGLFECGGVTRERASGVEEREISRADRAQEPVSRARCLEVHRPRRPDDRVDVITETLARSRLGDERFARRAAARFVARRMPFEFLHRRGNLG